MNKLGKNVFRTGVASQSISEIRILGSAYRRSRHLIHDSACRNFMENVSWIIARQILNENEEETWLPEVTGNPDTPPWADYFQRRKNTSVVLSADVKEMHSLAEKFPNAVASVTVRFEDIAMAGLFPPWFRRLKDEPRWKQLSGGFAGRE
jgi:hypothetical protein